MSRAKKSQMMDLAGSINQEFKSVLEALANMTVGCHVCDPIHYKEGDHRVCSKYN